jgi:hypothetical protein
MHAPPPGGESAEKDGQLQLEVGVAHSTVHGAAKAGGWLMASTRTCEKRVELKPFWQ